MQFLPKLNTTMEAADIQVRFFQHLKSMLPPYIAMVDAVADLLELSNDSAYRRIRGEKPISLEEMQKLAVHYNISLDQFMHIKSDAFIFNGRITNSTDFNFESWQKTVIEHLHYVASFKPNHYFYMAKEIPFLYYYLIPEIAAFKSYFFMKSILFYEDWKNAKFSVKDDYSKYHETWRIISNTYASIPCTEIWHMENITSTLHQIEFYLATGSLKSKDDAFCLLDKFEELVNHIEKQAEYGVKLCYGQQPSSSLPVYRMFLNELIMGDNMQVMQLGDSQVTYINHSVINFIMTRDLAFNSYMKRTIDIITQKSTPISEVNEKERLVFFNSLRAKINHTRQLVTV